MGDHGQGGTEAQDLENLDDLEDPNEFSIVDDAFERAELPSPFVEASPLGARPLDLFVAGILKAAGIAVEIVKQHSEVGDLYHVVQIVGEADLVAAFGVKEEENIKSTWTRRTCSVCR